MLKAKSFFLSVSILALAFTLISWGSTGHYKINTASGLSFNSEMAQFNVWVSLLAEHASDADIRKAWDPDEGPKHYIDIDNYPEFLSSGHIPTTLDSAIALHGSNFVYDNGILPWATLTSFDSLQACFERQDWEMAVLFAADLGHYIADGHMPMHITRNYNGQFTGNTGIHSRYESGMVNTYISQFIYEGSEPAMIGDVTNFVFDYLYETYPFVDSILAADDYAYALAGNTNSSTYKQALWEKTESFTIPLFSRSSHALATLIYTAWVNAGSPDMSPSAIHDQYANKTGKLVQSAPNPFTSSTKISFQLNRQTAVKLMVYDLNGRMVAYLSEGMMNSGEHQLEWWPVDLESGLYLLVLQTENSTDSQKVLYNK